MRAETHKMFTKAFGDKALGQTPTYKWFSCFKNGWMSVNNKHSEGHSTGTTIENVAKLQKAILEDRKWTIHHVCNSVGLLYGMCQRILSDELNKRCTAAKYVPRLMSSDQKELCIAICTDLKMTPTLFPSSSLVMNLGCLGTTLRRSSSHLGKRLQLHRDQRKHKFGAMSYQCWFVFWQQRHRP